MIYSIFLTMISTITEKISQFKMIIINDEKEPSSGKEFNVKLHDWNILPSSSSSSKNPNSNLLKYHEKYREKIKRKLAQAGNNWTVGDITKSGILLNSSQVQFEDEQEMRRIYSLIYDVFRYKNILNQALNDISFFQIYPKLQESIYNVWLLFYDLYNRNFKKRDLENFNLASKLFDSANLSFAENALWCQKVKLAAAVARLRIKHNALNLHELLPTHLKNEKVIDHQHHHVKETPISCWINSIKIKTNLDELFQNIEKTFDIKMIKNETEELLMENAFKLDKNCPQILTFPATMRQKLAKSVFIKEHFLVMQNKAFCCGAATFGQTLQDLGLSGSVIQTHLNSPRTTAYLATLLLKNEKIKKLLAFSAGTRKPEYENYFMQIGVTNIKIFSDRLIDSASDATFMEEVVAIFATPPNSYSAVCDPIDLVCSRGGDLSMMEILTESNQTKEAKERVLGILEEQKKTLRFAMSRPQIQFVLYETHSELDAENSGMITKTIKDINKMAKIQHAILQGKIPLSEVSIVEDLENLEVPLSELSDSILEPFNSKENCNKEKILEDIEIPDTDLFITPELPENETAGCYLSLIQRKEIIRLDDKYMIQMAENRGLFGSTISQNVQKTKRSKKKLLKADKKPMKSRKKLKETEVQHEASQTSDESESEEDEDIEEEEDLIRNNEYFLRPSSRSILSRLTSAHIRQFVSPDFKQDSFQFHAPSLSIKYLKKSTSKVKKETNTQNIPSKIMPQEKIHSKVNFVITKSASLMRKKCKKRKTNKFKKDILDRLCLPTLSFILKTSKTVQYKETENKGFSLHPVPSPCERFNRRNPL